MKLSNIIKTYLAVACVDEPSFVGHARDIIIPACERVDRDVLLQRENKKAISEALSSLLKKYLEESINIVTRHPGEVLKDPSPETESQIVNLFKRLGNTVDIDVETTLKLLMR